MVSRRVDDRGWQRMGVARLAAALVVVMVMALLASAEPARSQEEGQDPVELQRIDGGADSTDDVRATAIRTCQAVVTEDATA